MKPRTLGMLATGLVASVTWPAVGHATVVFSEDFSTLSGSPISPPPNPNPIDSQRGTGTYLSSITLPAGWNTVGNAGQILGFDLGGNGSNGDRALLLNEDGGPSNGIWRTIAGLVVGESYVLSFEYWGDNRTSPNTYSFTYEINGIAPITVNQTSPAVLNTGSPPFYTVSYAFTALASTTTLQFLETSGTQASPIFDNISISSVPEPASLALLGLGLLGLGVARRRRAN